MGSLDWMAAELRAAGVTVVEYPGWRGRRASGSFAPRGVIWHHDASAVGPSPSLPRLIAELGNGSTPPPLSQVWVDTAGRWHLTASGRANHAGIGSGWGRIRASNGNTDAIGIETDHTVGERWPAAQLQSLRRGTAVLLRHLGARPSDSLAGHKEYARGRKIDPDGLDMAAERRAVAAINPEENDMDANDTFWVSEWKDKTGTYGRFLWSLTQEVTDAKAEATANRAAIAALSAAVAADKDIDPAQLGQLIDAAVAAHTPNAQELLAGFIPVLQNALDEVLGADNQAQAKAVVDALVARLNAGG